MLIVKNRGDAASKLLNINQAVHRKQNSQTGIFKKMIQRLIRDELIFLNAGLTSFTLNKILLEQLI